MNKVLIIDTNPLLLLIVGLANLSYIASHKRIENLTSDHYHAMLELAGAFDEIVLIPQIVVEVHALAK